MKKSCQLNHSPTRLLQAVIAAAVLLGGAACGELRPLPGSFSPQEYTLISYGQLLDASQAGLQAGQKVRVPAYFWEFLTYDPAMVRNYLSYPRHPLGWYRLKWFATYGAPEMREYFDLAALDQHKVKEYPLKRMDNVMIYGELSSLGVGLYLRVHHMEKIEED
ncbi:MAG: hypothetical protein FJ134_04410 [Deltaproteobacteria bacterium]|nr:hypothetical protein [Deltaproteobacteria bacterium]